MGRSAISLPPAALFFYRNASATMSSNGTPKAAAPITRLIIVSNRPPGGLYCQAVLEFLKMKKNPLFNFISKLIFVFWPLIFEIPISFHWVCKQKNNNIHDPKEARILFDVG